MRSPFSKSKPSLFKRSSSSSSSTPSDAPVSHPATPQLSPLNPDSLEKISVVSEASSSPPLSKYSSPPPPPTSSFLAPPRCRVCSEPCKLLITRSSNRNGNAGRPYYKCVQDGVFACFADIRGDADANPACDCGVGSKRQLSSREKGRKIFYSCKLGACDFFQFHQRADGSEWEVDEDVAKALAELKVV